MGPTQGSGRGPGLEKGTILAHWRLRVASQVRPSLFASAYQEGNLVSQGFVEMPRVSL